MLDLNILRKTTFWDANLSALDKEQDKLFIISRVLERGTDAEIDYIETIYTPDEILFTLENVKGISKKTINFYKTIYR